MPPRYTPRMRRVRPMLHASSCVFIAVTAWVGLSSAQAPKANVGPARGVLPQPLPVKVPRPALPLPAVAGGLDVTVTPESVVGRNVQVAAVLYRAAILDEMKLFDAAERAAKALRAGTPATRGEAARAKLAAVEAKHPERLSKAERAELVAFVTSPVQLDFERGATDVAKQMKVYAALVDAVAKSASDFADENTTPNEQRDRLADDTRSAAYDLAITMSNHGYGAAHFAAQDLSETIRDYLALLSDAEVQGAFGTRSMHDLIAKLTGTPEADVTRLALRADAGSRLIASLANDVSLLDKARTGQAAARAVARAVAKDAPDARAWLTTKSPNVVGATKKANVLCFDGARRLTPCRVVRR